MYLPGLFKNSYRGPILPTPQVHREWAQIFVEKPRFVIEAPRYHAKTTIISRVCIIWDLLTNGINNLLISKNPTLSRITHRFIRQQLLNNELLRYDFGFKLLVENERTIVFNVDGQEVTLLSITAGGSFLGIRAGRITVDDGLNPENTNTVEQRKKLVDWWMQDVINILDDTGKAGWLGTPRHPQDMLQTLKKNPVYYCKRYPAIVNLSECKALWPEKWSFHKLNVRKKEIASFAFQQNFMCEPLDDETSRFPRSFLEGCLDKNRQMLFGRNGHRKVFMGCDFSVVSNKERAKKHNTDYTVFFTISLLEDGRRQILDIFRSRGMTFDETKNAFMDRVDRFKPDLCMLENNVFQDLYFQDLVKKYPFVRPHATGKTKLDINEGVPSLSAAFENKKYILPVGSEKSQELIDILIAEFNQFNIGNEHDDIVMACWLCELAIRKHEKYYTPVRTIRVRTGDPAKVIRPTQESAFN